MCEQELQIVSPEDTQALEQVIGRAKVCISSVVYSVDGESVVRACVAQRTDYVDSSVQLFPFLANQHLTRDYSAAVPTLLQSWIAKYHKKAEENGVAVGGISNRELEINRLITPNS